MRTRDFYNTLLGAPGRVSHKLDMLFIIAAIAYSLPSIGYPFGRDQALHFYIGREWLAGLVPYRDAFDNKPPGIYIIHALGIVMMGARQWAIRLMDLAAVLVTGLLTARVVRRDRPRLPGETGSLVLLSAGFYFTCFDYWDTAQVENWEGLALMAGYAVAESELGARRRAVLSGLLAGAAFLFKLPAALTGMVIAVIVALRTCKSSPDHSVSAMLRSLALYGCGFLSLAGLFTAYFIVRGGSGAMFEILYGFNTYCVLNPPVTADTAREWVREFWINHCGEWIWPAFGFWIVGTVLAVRRRAWRIVRGALVALFLLISAVASVYIQQKFYAYHWAVTAPFIMLCLGYGIAEFMRYLPRVTLAAVIGILMYTFLGAPSWYSNKNVTYPIATVQFWEYAAGNMPRDAYLKQFTGGYKYDYYVLESLGIIVRGRAQPGDRLHVRGFEPTVYAISGLRSPSRFFIENPLLDPAMNYHRAAWRAEHEQACWKNPPRFVVTFSNDSKDMAELIKRRYVKNGSAGRFVLFERGG